MPLVRSQLFGLQDAVTAVSNGNEQDVGGYGGAAFGVTGAFVGTVVFEASMGGSIWFPLPCIDVNGTRITQTTAPGVFWTNIVGIDKVRARVSAYTSGSVTVLGRSLEEPLPVLLSVVQSGIWTVDGVGTIADAAVTDPASSASIIALLKGLVSRTGGDISPTTAGNSTNATMGVGGVFTGTWQEVSEYGTVAILVIASHASATKGLSVQYSTNGTDIDDTDDFTIAANTGKFFTFAPEGRYFRVVYTNGGTAQTFFRLQTTFHFGYIKPSSHALTVDLTDDNDAELVRAILSGKKPDGTYTNVTLDSSGAMKVVGSFVPSDATVGSSFGTIQLGGGSVGTLNAIRATTYTQPSTNAQRSISSSSASDTAAGTGARTVTITYLDAAGAGPFAETVTLNGVTPVNTVATNICLIEKIVTATVGSAGTNVGTVTLFAATGGGGGAVGSIGVGNIVAAVGDGRTLWGHHYVPIARTAALATLSYGSGGTATFFLRSAPIPIGTNAETIITEPMLIAGALVRPSSIPVKVVGPAVITAYGVPATNNLKVNAAFDFSEVAS